jgi:ATP-dependent RNA helicase RhlB
VLELAYEHMNNPHLVQIEPDKKTATRSRQLVYFPANPEKPGAADRPAARMQASRTMVFVNTKREADHVAEVLTRQRHRRAAIVRRRAAAKRLKMLKDFQEGALAVLVATDVASRGLHIPT